MFLFRARKGDQLSRLFFLPLLTHIQNFIYQLVEKHCQSYHFQRKNECVFNRSLFGWMTNYITISSYLPKSDTTVPPRGSYWNRGKQFLSNSFHSNDNNYISLYLPSTHHAHLRRRISSMHNNQITNYWKLKNGHWQWFSNIQKQVKIIIQKFKSQTLGVFKSLQ